MPAPLTLAPGSKLRGPPVLVRQPGLATGPLRLSIVAGADDGMANTAGTYDATGVSGGTGILSTGVSRRSWYRFQSADVGLCATINSATLYLTATNAATGTPQLTFSAQ